MASALCSERRGRRFKSAHSDFDILVGRMMGLNGPVVENRMMRL